MRAQEIQSDSFTTWRQPWAVHSILKTLMRPLFWLNFRLLEALLTLQLGLWKCHMIPATRIEDSVNCSLSLAMPGLYNAFTKKAVHPVRAEIDEIQVLHNKDEAASRKVLRLSTGETLSCDVCILATGWIPTSLPILPSHCQDLLVDKSDGQICLYRHAVNPKLPNLGFVGRNSSFCTVLTFEVIAHRLLRYVDG